MFIVIVSGDISGRAASLSDYINDVGHIPPRVCFDGVQNAYGESFEGFLLESRMYIAKLVELNPCSMILARYPPRVMQLSIILHSSKILLKAVFAVTFRVWVMWLKDTDWKVSVASAVSHLTFDRAFHIHFEIIDMHRGVSDSMFSLHIFMLIRNRYSLRFAHKKPYCLWRKCFSSKLELFSSHIQHFLCHQKQYIRLI